jgi:integrase/recombinase XerD
MQTIYNRIKTEHGWRYERVEEGRGMRTGHLQPPFYVRYTSAKKQSWQRLLAKTFAEAKQEAEQLDAVADARAKGLTVAEAEKLSNANRITVKSAVDVYLAQKASKAPKTVLQYKRTLTEFLAALALSKVRFLDEINEAVLRKYKAFMEGEKYAGKTIDTRLNITYFLLKKNGVTARLPRDEMPTVEEEAAVPYTDEEIEKLFAAMDDESRIRYKFFLATGCRDKEATFAAWKDIDFAKREFHIRRKEDVGFTPKSHESRTVPLPVSLVDALKARHKKHPDDRWLFVNERGEPDNHFLRKLKRTALHAGLNCGECRTTITTGKYDRKKKTEVTCKTQPVCEHIYLHRFRKTCATRWQEHGIPIRTVQAWLGHKNLETTQRYLGVTDSGKLRPQIEAAFGD